MERTEAHTRQECELIAEALLKQSVNDVRSVSERIRNIRQQKCDLNALAAWAYLYAGTDEDGIRKIFEGSELPEGLAFLHGEDYHVLLGEFPREEFDAAWEARDNLSENWTFSVHDGGNAGKQGGYLEGNSALTTDGDNWYYDYNTYTYTDENGDKKPYYMGCYGIGLGRIIACLTIYLRKIWTRQLQKKQELETNVTSGIVRNCSSTR